MAITTEGWGCEDSSSTRETLSNVASPSFPEGSEPPSTVEDFVFLRSSFRRCFSSAAYAKISNGNNFERKKNRTRCPCSPILAKTWSLNRNAFGMSGSFGSTHPVHSQRDGTRRRRRSTHCSSWVGSSLRRPFVCSATCLAFGRSSRAGFSGPRLLVSVPICVSSHALKPRRAMHTCLCECGA